MDLVIVESPTKARTIARYLGKNYRVLSSFGHVRDLPKKKIGVDVKKNYQPSYAISPTSTKALKAIKEAVLEKKAAQVILATDEDREGEAIAYHLRWIIQRYAPRMIFQRITFHEITKAAIEKALQNPREIDLDLFNAQQARRVLDRLVGYRLSPLLWRKIRPGLSAGRVQSVALRMIVERERERENFKPQIYWLVETALTKKGEEIKKELKKEDLLSQPPVILAKLKTLNNQPVRKLSIEDKKQAEKIKKDLEQSPYVITEIKKRETKRYPAPPYKTSTLQRDAANKLGYSAKQTMAIAQKLYEGKKLKNGQVGLITYMRTDSLNVASSALKKAQEFIQKEYGAEYALEKPRFFTNKTKGAQEAHEAIRPTFPQKTPAELSPYLEARELKLYSLIWKKFIASQMREAIMNSENVFLQAGNYGLLAQGLTLKFNGFLKVYGDNEKEKQLPPLKVKEELALIKVFAEEYSTKPPARFNDAGLIKALEEKGIGRPSTYAPTLSTITSRGYVEKDEAKQYVPQEIGFLVNDLMTANFSEIVDYEFTAQMENNLDEIAEGKKDWVKIIDTFYKPFAENLKTKTETIKKYQKETDKKCPLCGKKLLEKFGRFGKFYACPGYPECKYTEDAKQEEIKELQKKYQAERCEKCGAPLEVKRGRWGFFLGCSNYPACKNLKKIENSSGIKCPLCQEGEIVEKKSRQGIFWACNNYPRCKNAMNGKPTGEKCPLCGSLMIENPRTGKIVCSNKTCTQGKK